MTKFKFDNDLMGKQVIVTQEFEREFKGYKRTWKPVNVVERRVGWIVGHSWVCNGIYNAGYRSGYCYSLGELDEDEFPSLKVTEKIPCILVTYWPSQNPIKIPVDGFIDYDEENIEHALLKPYCSAGYGSGEDRKRELKQVSDIMKEEVKFYLRDSKGRFSGIYRHGIKEN